MYCEFFLSFWGTEKDTEPKAGSSLIRFVFAQQFSLLLLLLSLSFFFIIPIQQFSLDQQRSL